MQDSAPDIKHDATKEGKESSPPEQSPKSSSSSSNHEHHQTHHHHHLHHQHQQQTNQADELCKDVQASIRNAIDMSNRMPIQEFPLYSSYNSYDKVMQHSRKTIHNMMNKLAACSISGTELRNSMVAGQPSTQNSLHHYISQSATRNTFNQTDSLQDRYDRIGDFNEVMLDRVATNLDEAEGLKKKDAQLIEATLGKNDSRNYNLYRNSNSISPTSNTANNQQHSKHKNADITNYKKQDVSRQSTASQASSSNDINNSVSGTSGTSNYNENISSSNNNYTCNSGKIRQPYNAKSMQHSINQQTQPTHAPHMHNHTTNKQSLYHRHVVLENKNIQRPQASFQDKIDNSSRPFEPLIKTKPNALVPLKCFIQKDKYGTESYSHPYEYEIENFEIKPELLEVCQPQQPPEIEETPLTLVEDIDQLKEMCAHIERLPEIAVDVEHHSYRSFQGISCLIQISSRTRDFVIDAIKLRSELHVLNESFTNPNIVKVFHGADCDIIWLQRDFGVYVVNLFDTCRAAKLMKFAHLSLAFLMKHYCGVVADKYYQLADWRERPLSLPMINYARTDTHYLLYIYDRLRNDLLYKGAQTRTPSHLLSAVYERGKDICLKKYEKPTFSETSHLSALKKCRSTFNARQMHAFKELYAWRDSISRELDESLGYVLPNNLMIRISEYLPREPQGIIALCNPVPPMVKRFVNDIHQLITEAREIPLDEVKVITEGVEYTPESSLKSLDLDAIGHRQDVAHSAGIQESTVPPLLGMMFQSVSINSSDEKAGNVNNGLLSNTLSVKNEIRHNFDQNPESTLYNFFGQNNGNPHRDSRHGRGSPPEGNNSWRHGRANNNNSGSWRGNSRQQATSDSATRGGASGQQRGNSRQQQRGNSRPTLNSNNQQRQEQRSSGNQAHNNRKFELFQSQFTSPYKRYVSTSQQQQQQKQSN